MAARRRREGGSFGRTGSPLAVALLVGLGYRGWLTLKKEGSVDVQLAPCKLGLSGAIAETIRSPRSRSGHSMVANGYFQLQPRKLD